MPGGAGTRWYSDRDPVWKGLLIYAASPLVAAVMIVGVFFPYVILLIALAAGVAAAVSPSRR